MRLIKISLWPALLHAFCLVGLFLLALFATPAVKAQEGNRSVVTRVPPVYPALASRMHVSGTVVLIASVQANGSVHDVHATSGHALLRGPAEEAVRLWKFTRAPDPSDVEIKVQFQLEALNASGH